MATNFNFVKEREILFFFCYNDQKCHLRHINNKIDINWTTVSSKLKDKRNLIFEFQLADIAINIVNKILMHMNESHYKLNLPGVWIRMASMAIYPICTYNGNKGCNSPKGVEMIQECTGAAVRDKSHVSRTSQETWLILHLSLLNSCVKLLWRI